MVLAISSTVKRVDKDSNCLGVIFGRCIVARKALMFSLLGVVEGSESFKFYRLA